MELQFNLKKFAELIAQKRYDDRLGVREAAEQANTSPSTISRCENGKLPEVITFARLCKWLGVPMETFIKKSKNKKL